MLKIWLKHTLILFLANRDTAVPLVTHVRLHTPMSTDLGSSYSTHLYQKGTPTTETLPTTALFRLFQSPPSYANTVGPRLLYYSFLHIVCFQAPVQPGSMDSESGIFSMVFDQSGSRLITTEADKTIKIYKEDDTAVSTCSTVFVKYILFILHSSQVQVLYLRNVHGELNSNKL